jgi:hypothetical protein
LVPYAGDPNKPRAWSKFAADSSKGKAAKRKANDNKNTKTRSAPKKPRKKGEEMLNIGINLRKSSRVGIQQQGISAPIRASSSSTSAGAVPAYSHAQLIEVSRKRMKG